MAHTPLGEQAAGDTGNTGERQRHERRGHERDGQTAQGGGNQTLVDTAAHEGEEHDGKQHAQAGTDGRAQGGVPRQGLGHGGVAERHCQDCLLYTSRCV